MKIFLARILTLIFCLILLIPIGLCVAQAGGMFFILGGIAYIIVMIFTILVIDEWINNVLETH